MKLSFAAPESGLPFLSIAFGSQASFEHFAMKLFNAAPASGFPSFPIALLRHVSCASAPVTAPEKNTAMSAARTIFFIVSSLVMNLCGASDCMIDDEHYDSANHCNEHAPQIESGYAGLAETLE